MWLFTDVYVTVLCLFQWQNLSKSVMGCFDVVLSSLSVRSEERRVGKECVP